MVRTGGLHPNTPSTLKVAIVVQKLRIQADGVLLPDNGCTNLTYSANALHGLDAQLAEISPVRWPTQKEIRLGQIWPAYSKIQRFAESYGQ